MEQWTGSQLGKEYIKAFYCHSVYLTYIQSNIMRNAGLDEAQAGIRIAGRNINNLRHADDTTLMAKNEDELNSLLMKVKEESEKAGLKLNIHQMVNTEIRLIIFFAAKDGVALYTQQKQHPELTMAQIMNSLLPNSDLKKVGKTTRPFRYDLNQISYDYTVEVRNRFKGLDLTRVSDELWTEVHDIVQEAVIKIILKKKNGKKAK